MIEECFELLEGGLYPRVSEYLKNHRIADVILRRDKYSTRRKKINDQL